MDLSLNERQELLRNTTKDFMDHEAPVTVVTDWDRKGLSFVPEIWNQVAKLGWLGMAVPREYGGGDSSFLDAAIVFQELGKGPLPGPFFSSGVLSAQIIVEAGSEQQKKDILPGICQGDTIATLAVNEPSTKWGPETLTMTATKQGNNYVLNGVKLFVHDAVPANHYIIPVRTSGSGENGITLFWVPKNTSGVSVRPLSGFAVGLGEVKLENVQVPASNVLGAEGQGWPLLDKAIQKSIPILSAYQVGGCEKVFDISVSYSQTRIVFTQPIGRFQRVQDHIIELANHMDAAKWVTYEALWKLDNNRDDTLASIHEAKAVASEGYYQACNYAHEAHGGIGISREYGLVVHSTMSRTLYQYLGDPRYHKRKMVDALGF